MYCAVPHHLHEEVYVASSRRGSTCWARSRSASTWRRTRRSTARSRADLLVRCSSELPFYPGGQAVARWIAEGRFGRVLEVRSLFLHSSDLDPGKPINWKRDAAFNGAYGCMGDLGMHAQHLPLRAGWSRAISERSSRTSSPSGPALTAHRLPAIPGTTPCSSATPPVFR